MKIYINILLVSVISLGAATIAVANTTRENEALARIVHVINEIKPLINEAELQHDSQDRLMFDYSKLRSDLEKIKAGIQHKFDQSLIEPRAIQPIEGDYVSIRNKVRG